MAVKKKKPEQVDTVALKKRIEGDKQAFKTMPLYKRGRHGPEFNTDQYRTLDRMEARYDTLDKARAGKVPAKKASVKKSGSKKK